MSGKVNAFIQNKKDPLEIIEVMDIIYFNSHFKSLTEESDDESGEYEEESEYEKILNRYRIKGGKGEDIFKQLQPILVKEYFGIKDYKQIKCIQKEMFEKKKKGSPPKASKEAQSMDSKEEPKSILFQNLDSQPNIVVEKILMNLDRESILAFCDTSEKMKGQCVTLSEKMWKWLILRDCFIQVDKDPAKGWSFKTYKKCSAPSYDKWIVNAAKFGEFELVEILMKDKENHKYFSKALAVAEQENNVNVAEFLKTFLRTHDFIKEYSDTDVRDITLFKQMQKNYENAAESGNSSAMLFLANNARSKKNKEKYYMMAIDTGYTKAMIDYAKYLEAIGEFEEGLKYLEMAVDKGDDEAMYEIGLYYSIRDEDKMIEYYEMAAEKGNLKAILYLAKNYHHNTTSRYEYDKKLKIPKEDFEKAEKYYEMAIKQHDSIKAITGLALLYDDLDKTKMAEKYYKLAIEKGDNQSLFNLGKMYEKNKNYKEMNHYYSRAIGKGVINAVKSLGKYYEETLPYDKVKRFYERMYNKFMDVRIRNFANQFYVYQARMGNLDAFEETAKIYEIKGALKKKFLKEYKKALKTKDTEMIKEIVKEMRFVWSSKQRY